MKNLMKCSTHMASLAALALGFTLTGCGGAQTTASDGASTPSPRVSASPSVENRATNAASPRNTPVSQANNSRPSYNPDEDAEFQKYLQDELFSNDDPLFTNPKYRESAAQQIYSLQDPCARMEGDAFAMCKAKQECTAEDGSEGLTMDIVMGRAGETDRSPRGAQLCATKAQVAAATRP